MKKNEFKLGLTVMDTTLNREMTVVGLAEFLVNNKPYSPINFQVKVTSEITKEGTYTGGKWYDKKAQERLRPTQ